VLRSFDGRSRSGRGGDRDGSVVGNCEPHPLFGFESVDHNGNRARAIRYTSIMIGSSLDVPKAVIDRIQFECTITVIVLKKLYYPVSTEQAFLEEIADNLYFGKPHVSAANDPAVDGVHRRRRDQTRSLREVLADTAESIDQNGSLGDLGEIGRRREHAVYFIEHRHHLGQFNMLKNIFGLKYFNGTTGNWERLDDVMIDVSRRRIEGGDSKMCGKLR